MNIYLIPYTWIRHIAVALVLGGSSLLTWWFTLVFVVRGGPIFESVGMLWWQSMEGLLFLGNLAASIAFMSLFLEGALRRRAMVWRIAFSLFAAMVAWTFTAIGYGLISGIYSILGDNESMAILKDSSLVSLRWRLPMWWCAGMSSGLGAFMARKIQGVLARYGYGLDNLGVESDEPPVSIPWGDFFGDAGYHIVGGFLASGFGAAVWHFCGMYTQVQGDLYLGSALGALVWGIVYGLFVWTIPRSMYAGWIRVLSNERYGLRIPVDRPEGGSSERFIGHFPRGLDLYLPGESGVAELHTSFVVDSEQRYSVRGLSQQPTRVSRFLESIDLSYAPNRPAPLETPLSMEDRVYMGNGEKESVVEFLLLPKEEI